MELQEFHWGHGGKINSAYLRWKYEENPYFPKPVIWLALADGKLAGMRGMYGSKWRCGAHGQEKECVIPCAGDVVIHPDHRSRGLATALTRAALDELEKSDAPLVFNLSSGEITFMNFLAMGWRGIGPLGLWEHSRTGADMISLLTNFLEGHAFRRFDRRLGGGLEREGVRLRATSRPESSEMAALVDQLRTGDGIQHVRDRTYFEWRYRNPLSTYRFLLAYSDKLEGYLVLRSPRKPTGYEVVSLVDWEGSDEAIKIELLRAAIHNGGFRRLNIWTAGLGETLKEALVSEGFEPRTPRGMLDHARPTVLVRPVRESQLKSAWTLGQTPLIDLKKWDLRMIYSDAY